MCQASGPGRWRCLLPKKVAGFCTCVCGSVGARFAKKPSLVRRLVLGRGYFSHDHAILLLSSLALTKYVNRADFHHRKDACGGYLRNSFCHAQMVYCGVRLSMVESKLMWTFNLRPFATHTQAFGYEGETQQFILACVRLAFCCWPRHLGSCSILRNPI